MILIVDDTVRRMRTQLRDSLISLGIPCALTDSDKIHDFLPCRTLLLTERYLLRELDYIKDMYSDCEMYVLCEDADPVTFAWELYHSIGRRAYPDGIWERTFCEDGDFRRYAVEYGLTKRERLIVRMLLISACWESAEKIERYCSDSPKTRGSVGSSVKVHVCNINKKANYVSGIPLIEQRRFSGYRIDTDILEDCTFFKNK